MAHYVITCSGYGGPHMVDCDCDASEAYSSEREMKVNGWTDISHEWPGGLLWSHVGLCPDCTARKAGRASLFPEPQEAT